MRNVRALSVSEKVGMSPCPEKLENKNTFPTSIDEEPIRSNVAFIAMCEITLQGMVPVLPWEFLPFRKHPYDSM